MASSPRRRLKSPPNAAIHLRKANERRFWHNCLVPALGGNEFPTRGLILDADDDCGGELGRFRDPI